MVEPHEVGPPPVDAVSVPAVRRRRRLLWVWAASAGGAVVWVAGLALIGWMLPGPADSTSSTAQDQIRTGDCVTGSNLGLGTSQLWPAQVQHVPCSQTHLAEAFFADASYWSGPYPGDSVLSKQGFAACTAAFAAYVGISDADSKYTWNFVEPTAANWNDGDRELYCVAYQPTSGNPGGIPITGSIKNSRR